MSTSTESTSTRVATRREQERELKIHQRKDNLLWVPLRCEGPNCTVVGEGKGLKKCASCNLVFYCGTACQREDWPRHKVECRHLKGLNLWGCKYTEQQEQVRFPLGSISPKGRADGGKRVRHGSGAACGICGSETNKLKTTSCCGNLVCDNEEEYQMFSYSRAFCGRSHSRYTACALHHDAGHAGDDWRQCSQCIEYLQGEWYSTNGYNFTPGLFPPKPRFLTEECETCHGRIHAGFESFTRGRRGTQCSGCNLMPVH